MVAHNKNRNALNVDWNYSNTMRREARLSDPYRRRSKVVGSQHCEERRNEERGKQEKMKYLTRKTTNGRGNDVWMILLRFSLCCGLIGMMALLLVNLIPVHNHNGKTKTQSTLLRTNVPRHNRTTLPRTLSLISNESYGGHSPTERGEAKRLSELPIGEPKHDEESSSDDEGDAAIDKDCIYQGSWQKSRPVLCNSIHEIDMIASPESLQMIACGGSKCTFQITDFDNIPLALKRHK